MPKVYCKHASGFELSCSLWNCLNSPRQILQSSLLFYELWLGSPACILDPVMYMVLCWRIVMKSRCLSLSALWTLALYIATVPLKFKDNQERGKKSLDHELYPSHRPISNLRFVSKTTEKVIATRLNERVNNGDLIELFQSAYRAGHSTDVIK